MRTLINLIRDNRGATAIEYALVASLMSIAAISAFQALGAEVDVKYQSINRAL